MTTLIAWVAIDHRAPSALYFASDSRITWGSRARRWDVGRKLFACKNSPDLFGYVGEVLFPSLVLSQITDAADNGLIIGADDDAVVRHASFVQAIKLSFSNRHNAPDFDFEILHAARVSSGMSASFRCWHLSYNVKTKTWIDNELIIKNDSSGLVVAIGSGAKSFERQFIRLRDTPQGRTSRAAFWAFCDALKVSSDPLTGGAPQLSGLYRTEAPKSFGLVYEGRRYYQGLPLAGNVRFDGVEWRDEYFQRVAGERMQVTVGAQRHGRE